LSFHSSFEHALIGVNVQLQVSFALPPW